MGPIVASFLAHLGIDWVMFALFSTPLMTKRPHDTSAVLVDKARRSAQISVTPHQRSIPKGDLLWVKIISEAGECAPSMAEWFPHADVDCRETDPSLLKYNGSHLRHNP